MKKLFLIILLLAGYTFHSNAQDTTALSHTDTIALGKAKFLQQLLNCNDSQFCKIYVAEKKKQYGTDSVFKRNQGKEIQASQISIVNQLYLDQLKNILTQTQWEHYEDDAARIRAAAVERLKRRGVLIKNQDAGATH